MPSPSKLVRNERTKLLATGLNNIGIATIVAGTIGPFVARSYGASAVSGLVLPVILGLIYLAVRTSLMFLARVTLKELVE